MTIECPICLDKITTSKPFFQRIKNKARVLMCGHVFHEKCIAMIHKPTCPMCIHPIFNQQEESIIQSPTPHTLLKETKDTVNTLALFQHATRFNLPLLKDALTKHCDFTHVLFQNIGSVDTVKSIINCKINWFQTFNGLTFLELARATGNREIITIINRKFPLSKPTRRAPPPPNSHLYTPSAPPASLFNYETLWV
jgi:hypothetical protein